MNVTNMENETIHPLRDADIREPLFDWLEDTFGKLRVIEEKQTGKARADIVMVLPDKVCGIEIKSDADTYTRLPGQVKNYDRYYDENYIVAGSTHGLHVAEHVPDYWGIITVERLGEGLDFYMLRQAKPNPHAKMENKVRLLWRAELAHILEACGMPKYARKSRRFIAGKLAAKVPEEILHKLVSEELFERDYTVYRDPDTD